jgi:hypothetical protein
MRARHRSPDLSERSPDPTGGQDGDAERHQKCREAGEHIGALALDSGPVL